MTTTAQRICPDCGTANSESGKFCIKCGALLPFNTLLAPPLTSEPLSLRPQPAVSPATRSGKIEYDPRIIEKFAIRLYRTAWIVIVLLTLIGLAGGGFGGYSLASWGDDEIVWAAGGALILGGLGFWLGWEVAFRLKLRAQLALCQVQIEENTR